MTPHRAAVGCLLVVALGACGGSGDDGATAAPSPASSPSAEPSASPSAGLREPVEIVFEPTEPGVDLETLRAQVQTHMSEVYFGTKVEVRGGQLVVRTREDVEEVTEEIVGDLEIRGILDGPPRPERLLDPCLPGPAATDLVVEDGDCNYLTALVVPTTGLLDVADVGTDQVKITLDDPGLQALRAHLQGPLAGSKPEIAFVSDERIILTVDMRGADVATNELVFVYDSEQHADFNRFVLNYQLGLGFAPLRRVS